MHPKPADRRSAIWLSDPTFAAAEIARDIGYGAVVLDIEHGSFDLADLERFVPFPKALGLEVLAKFPPLGDRSFAGGRTTRCLPMIEDAGALEQMAAIDAEARP